MIAQLFVLIRYQPLPLRLFEFHLDLLIGDINVGDLGDDNDDDDDDASDLGVDDDDDNVVNALGDGIDNGFMFSIAKIIC